MSETTKTLLNLEQQMLAADAAFDAEFFRTYCTEDFTVVSPYGISTREQVLAMYTQGSGDPDRRSDIRDPRVMVLDHGSALVTYELASTAGGTTSSMYSTSVYRRTPDGWRLAFLQQTPSQ